MIGNSDGDGVAFSPSQGGAGNRAVYGCRDGTVASEVDGHGVYVDVKVLTCEVCWALLRWCGEYLIGGETAGGDCRACECSLDEAASAERCGCGVGCCVI